MSAFGTWHRPLSRERTYVVLAYAADWRTATPLGTVVCRTRTQAREVAGVRWPSQTIGLRLVTDRSVRADLVARALALDGRGLMRC